MTTQQFLNDLEDAIEVQRGTISPAAKLTDLPCWDSMAALTFMSLADQKLQVSVSGRDLEKCQSVPDLLALLAPKLQS